MKTCLTAVLLLLTLTHFSEGFLCYEQNPGESWTITVCTNSCYSTGVKLLGIEGKKTGCADQKYPEICQAASFIGIGEHACFCNGILCNASSFPTVYMPLLLIPLLQKLLA
ncbi:hypothetical protein SK128_028484 [Halocaridina rubra]|uniref:Uncharacterized protein n=1 Tax=Halocaridina rubra TaxID=373956 RepID=A0AAN8X8U6_HALRR